MAKAKTIRSGIIYHGPSMIDGQTIVVIGIKSASNRKTGVFVQTYIIRPDVDPITANRIGADVSICGNCKHKGKANPAKTKGLANGRTCYVNIGQGPLQVYKAFKAGKYETLTDPEIIALGAGNMVRIGTYGDGAAVPQSRLALLKSKALGFTAYSHNVEKLGDNAQYYMHSADSLQEAKHYHAKGYRTFRVIPVSSQNEPLLQNEIMCPRDKGIQCKDCRLCNGGFNSKTKSIAIVAHGPTARKVI
jgi:hypothetical protein